MNIHFASLFGGMKKQILEFVSDIFTSGKAFQQQKVTAWKPAPNSCVTDLITMLANQKYLGLHYY